MIISSPVFFLFLFLIQLSCVLTSSPWSPPSSHLVPADECNALLQFGASFTINPKIETLYFCNENYLNFTSYPTTTSWKEGTDCCSWHGVTCDNVTGNVIALDLHCSYLQGTLHSMPSLSSLLSLQRLNLTGNNLTGNIPSSLCQKTSLKVLSLVDNHLTGNIPPCLGNLTNLEFLGLSYNRLGGPLPRSLANCTRLGVLFLAGNEISDTFPLWLHSLPLIRLHISGNNFHGQLVEPDSPTFPFPHLEYFIINGNNLSGTLPPTYLLNSSMKFITMSHNQLEGDMPIPPATAEFYEISGNRFTGKIPPSICNNTNLINIILWSNRLSGEIPRCLVNKNPHLVELDLRRNTFQGPIPEISAPNCSLKSIELTYNQLGGKLPRSLAMCKSLEILDVGGNQIEDMFPSWLEALPNLYFLGLRSNKLHGLIDPPKISDPFSKLHILDVSSNGLYGTFPTQYMANFGDMMGRDKEPGNLGYRTDMILTIFSASIMVKGVDWDLEGLPKSFVAIDLSCNQFQGELPEVLGNLKSLIGLNVSHNNLTGPIPYSLGNLTNLEWLDLSSNNLTGEIPAALADLTYLARLNLSNNQLEGPIPHSKQFAGSFGADSFDGNAGLCGLPLPRLCGEDANKPPPPTSHEVDEEDAEHRNWIEWQAVAMGSGCGTIVGISLAQIVLVIRRPLWLMKILHRIMYRLETGARGPHRRGIRGQGRRQTTR